MPCFGEESRTQNPEFRMTGIVIVINKEKRLESHKAPDALLLFGTLAVPFKYLVSWLNRLYLLLLFWILDSDFWIPFACRANDLFFYLQFFYGSFKFIVP